MSEPSAQDLQVLALMRFDDAKVLLANSRHSAAFYLCGYSVECGLKAVIALAFRQSVIPDRRFVDKVYKHDLNELVGTAGLKTELESEQALSAEFKANWAFAANWSEAARYETIDPFTAHRMLDAVGDPKNGILRWLKTHW